MSYKEDYSKIDGVWRTVGGRRIFIKTGQTLKEAMIESGKFKTGKNKTKEKFEKLQKKIDELKDKEYSLELEKRKAMKESHQYYEKRKRVLKDKYKDEQAIEEYDLKHKEELDRIKGNCEKIINEINDFVNSKEYKSVYEEFKKLRETFPKDLFGNPNAHLAFEKEENLKLASYLKIKSEIIAEDVLSTSNIRRIDLMIELDKIAQKEGLVISKSPYGASYYAHESWEEISWGYKPHGSYRVSDHWGFESKGAIHCRIDDDEYKQEWLIGKYDEHAKMYHSVKRKGDD